MCLFRIRVGAFSEKDCEHDPQCPVAPLNLIFRTPNRRLTFGSILFWRELDSVAQQHAWSFSRLWNSLLNQQWCIYQISIWATDFSILVLGAIRRYYFQLARFPYCRLLAFTRLHGTLTRSRLKSNDLNLKCSSSCRSASRAGSGQPNCRERLILRLPETAAQRTQSGARDQVGCKDLLWICKSGRCGALAAKALPVCSDFRRALPGLRVKGSSARLIWWRFLD